jgi:hypothetical protein
VGAARFYRSTYVQLSLLGHLSVTTILLLMHLHHRTFDRVDPVFFDRCAQRELLPRIGQMACAVAICRMLGICLPKGIMVAQVCRTSIMPTRE